MFKAGIYITNNKTCLSVCGTHPNKFSCAYVCVPASVQLTISAH